jgi:hypothetical protein
MLTEIEILDYAATWLSGRYPQDFHGKDSWVIVQLVDSEYPTGFAGFTEDINQANNVS